jgi:single-strand DNA-binding protein
MADFNRVFLIGRLTHDPELRYTTGGAAVTDLRMATSRQYQGRDGTPQKETLYIDVEVWNRQAENCCQFLKKGRQIHVEGYLKMESWEDKQTGQSRNKIKVSAMNVQFLDRREDSPGSHGGEDDSTAGTPRRPMTDTRGPAANGPGRGAAYGSSSNPARRPPSPQSESDIDPEADEDIPF